MECGMCWDEKDKMGKKSVELVHFERAPPRLAHTSFTPPLLLMQDFNSVFLINILGIIVVGLSTFFVSVPIHSELMLSRSSEQIIRLVKTNWLRTIVWSIRSCFLIFYLSQTLKG